MKIATFCMTAANGWAVPTPPSFDPSRTLVVAFGDPAFLDAHEPIRRLAAAYPGATLQGCSSSGEIFGTHIVDHSAVRAMPATSSPKVDRWLLLLKCSIRWRKKIP